ncbi:Tn3 family transposase [Streptomyces sp. DH37]|nr:Tn3 family transposase [Streptomyces sp. DH37]MDG9701552.1 Tn3 family transposase [Streptomyces sp. DH37]
MGVKSLLPREVEDRPVPPAWRKAVYANPDLPQGAVDRRAYAVCAPERLHRGLDAGWEQLAERLEEAGPAAKVSVEVQDDGRVKPNVDKPGALGLVLNAIVLRTTRYIDAAVTRLQAEGRGPRAEGHEIREEDIARLSPLEHENLSLLGRCGFTASVPAAGVPRPPRDPDVPELDEDGSPG